MKGCTQYLVLAYNGVQSEKKKKNQYAVYLKLT